MSELLNTNDNQYSHKRALVLGGGGSVGIGL